MLDVTPVPVLRPNGPILLFGGAYSNLEATEALLKEAERLAIPRDRIICTGDVVAYYADAAATARLVRTSVAHVVMGNCEESIAAGAGDCGCGFPSGSACDRLSGAWFGHASTQLCDDDRAWMRALPRRIDIEIQGVRFAVVHGGVETINRFIFASTAAPAKLSELDLAGVAGIIAGHCGLPFSQVLDGRLWHNPGAIGMPANDGTPRVWFSIVASGPEGITIEHRAIEYDFRAAAAKMRAAALPEDYATALETGLWPSCDVLPLREIRERGVPLMGEHVSWHPAPGLALASRKGRPVESALLWPGAERIGKPRLNERKFKHPLLTAEGAPRASVELTQLKTLWFNTGTLCNIACRNCYIESSPRNDRLAYISLDEVSGYLDEIERHALGTEEIGFTGGEPFMNPAFVDILEQCLERGFRVLVLTNAMRPMARHKSRLSELRERFGVRLAIRVSLDHFTPERHDEERGLGTFKPTLDGLIWLARAGFSLTVAGRTMWGGSEHAQRSGYAALFARHGLAIDADDPLQLVLFPEMEEEADVPEITTACWGILGKSPSQVMCSSSRMIVKRKGAATPTVVACTLLPYDGRFELGTALRDTFGPVPLNHPHCAKFCVLGGASCSADPGRPAAQKELRERTGRSDELSHAG